jgi:hypothetical protein
VVFPGSLTDPTLPGIPAFRRDNSEKGGIMRFARRYPVIKGLSLLGPLLTAALAHAGFDVYRTHGIWENTSFWENVLVRPHNFSQTASSGRNYLGWTTPIGQPSVKYTDYILNNQTGNQYICYEITTKALSYSATATDTRFWTQVGPSTWRSVSDDVNGSSDRTSAARVWIAPNSGLTLRVSAYDANSNGIDFKIWTVQQPEGSSLADCQNSPFPFVSVNNGWPQVTGGT